MENYFNKSGGFMTKDFNEEMTSLELYLHEIEKFPLLSKEEEKELGLRLLDGDEDAKAKLIESNLRLVVFIAKKYRGRGIPLLDLIQEGNLGLQASIEKYDVTKGVSVSTYAYRLIVKFIINALREKSKTIKIPRDVYAKIVEYKQAYNELSKSLKREPSVLELANKLNVGVSTINQLVNCEKEILSLNVMISDDAEFGDFVAVNKTNPEDIIMDKEYLKQIRDSLLKANLTEKQLKVILWRFGFTKDLTLEETGKLLNISGESVRRIESRAIKKLQKVKKLFI